MRAMRPDERARDEWDIDARELSKRYASGVVAVDRLNLRVRRGEIYGFIGPNGAGKTTVLRMLLGLMRPSSGSVTVLGAAPGSRRSLDGLGALIETPTFYPYLSARDNLRAVARYAGLSDAHVEPVLELVDLAARANDAFRTFSLGMKQRLGVAAALIKDPRLLILDEPTNGLDPPGMADMRELIGNLGRSGRTVLFSSHQLQDVERLCDRVGIIARGRLQAEGTVAELCAATGVLIRAEPLDLTARVAAALLGEARVHVVERGVLADADPSDTPALVSGLVVAGVSVHEIRPRERSLEERFFELTGSRAGAALGSRANERPHV